MIKLFIAPYLNGQRELHLIASYFKREDVGDTLFSSDEILENFAYKNFCFVSNITESHYVLIPHPIKQHNPEIDTYLSKVRDLVNKNKKKIVVFIGGDLSHNVFIDDMIVLKGSQYGRLKKRNEIIVPPFIQDLGTRHGFQIRRKSLLPVVGFCGWADFSGKLSWVKYYFKILAINLSKIIFHNSNLEVFKKGIFFRRKAIEVVRKSSILKSNIIIRKSFSGNLKTVSKSVGEVRDEYVKNIIGSDFILAPKGDGNFSLRFYETLSMGRIPVFIDTDCVLPLEKYINYEDVLVRIPYQNIDKLDFIIRGAYDSWSEEEFISKQKMARELFLSSLRYDSFFNLLFSKPLEEWLD